MGLCYHSFSETPAESCDLCVEIVNLRAEVERMTKMGPGHTCWATMDTAQKEALIEQRDKAYRELDAMKLQNRELRADVDKFNKAMMETLAERDNANRLNGEIRTAALNILHEIASDSDGGQNRYESYGPLFDAVWNTSQKPFQGPQILAPSGSCPCRTEGEVLIACERHAIKPNREGLCTNDRDGEQCLKREGHEGICEGPKNVWDWKPTTSRPATLKR